MSPKIRTKSKREIEIVCIYIRSPEINDQKAIRSLIQRESVRRLCLREFLVFIHRSLMKIFAINVISTLIDAV